MKKYDIKQPLENLCSECWDVLVVTGLVSRGIIPGPADAEAAEQAQQQWREGEGHVVKALELAGLPFPTADGADAQLDAAVGRFNEKYRSKKTDSRFVWQVEEAAEGKNGAYSDAAAQAILNAKTDAYAHLMLAVTAWMDYGFRTEANLGILEPDGKLTANGYAPKNNEVTPNLVAARECFLSALEHEGFSKAQVEEVIAANYPDLKKTFDAINENESKKGGCYVATAVYGSYDCPQVWTLRRFRDYSLAESRAGRLFVHVYYATSPTLVRWFGSASWFKKACRAMLDPFVVALRGKGYADTPYDDREW